MERWQKFLDSLGTKGGNTFVLILFVSSLLMLVMHLHNDPSSVGQTVVLTTFSGFSGALLRDLGGAPNGSTAAPPANGSTPAPKS
jgi:hypothetical protein